MKKLNLLLIVLLAMISFSSCEKDEDEGKLPNISLKTTAGYVSADIILKKDTTVTVGIQATKAEDNDVLKSFEVQQSLDGATATSLYTETLTGTSGDSYSHDQLIHTRTVAGTEKYTFTVVNKDGLKNQVTVTVTVQ